LVNIISLLVLELVKHVILVSLAQRIDPHARIVLQVNLMTEEEHALIAQLELMPLQPKIVHVSHVWLATLQITVLVLLNALHVMLASIV